ncbi:hypothetical protein QTP88_005369 [Uroleucon formosanum]
MEIRIRKRNGTMNYAGKLWKKRRVARADFIRSGNQGAKDIFLIERKSCKRILQREKRKFINRILEEAEKDHSRGRIRNFFKTIGQYKGFNPILKATKGNNGDILMESSDKFKRWREYFIDLLNTELPVDPIENAHYQTAEPMISDITLEEVKIAINSLKNWKAPSSDNIPAELIKCGGVEMHKSIFKLCQKIWEEEQMPEDWKKVIIIPIYKKGDKTECGNYRGISLLNLAYKVLSKVLMNRISPYIEENLGEYQCGFRRTRSTIEQISVIVEIGLKQGDALSSILFNFVLEKAVREMQKEATGVEINQRKVQILGFADDLNIVGNTREDTEKTLKVLEKSADRIGLKINVDKTKIMELLDTDTDTKNPDQGDLIYEKVNEFKYFGVCINTRNDWSKRLE